MSGRGSRVRGESVSKSARAGLVFPVSRVRRYLRRSTHHQRISVEASVYLAAVLEYVTVDLLELAGYARIENKRWRVAPRHILLAIGFDEVLKPFLRNVTIRGGGVMPGIHSELLAKKKKRPRCKMLFDSQTTLPPAKKPVYKTAAQKRDLPSTSKKCVPKKSVKKTATSKRL